MNHENFYVINIYVIQQQQKIKSYCHTKHPAKDQVKKFKTIISQWINDDKSVYIREDLAYKLICYSNLGVIKADKIKKNLGISNNQSIRR